MTLTLLLADSEVAAIDAAAGGVVIRLSAAHVEQPGAAPGDRPLAGFARGVLLWLDAAARPAPGALFGRIAGGRVRLGGPWQSRLVLPSLHRGPVTLEVEFANQSHLTLSAQGLECRFDGDPNLTESMAC